MNELTENKQGFSLQPKSMEEAMKFAEMISGSQMVPKDFKGKPSDTLVAMMLGSELGLNPLQALQNIAVINGRPSIWGDAMLALVQNNQNFERIKETFDDNTMTATCVIKRKGSEAHAVTFSKADAETAKLWNKQGPWVSYPKRMLKLRARGFALRDQFSDALSGLISSEEAQDFNVIDITDQQEAADTPVTEDGFLSQDKFNEMYPAWVKQIEGGKEPERLIAFLAHKQFNLSDTQKELIMRIGK